MTQDIRIEDFNYPLPDERIARHPLQDRDKCLLLVRNSKGDLSTHIFYELPDLLPSDSLLIYNNTKVINARLRFRKESGIGVGAQIEVFCLEPESPEDYALSFAREGKEGCAWICFMGNSKRWKEGHLYLTVRVGDRDVRLSAYRREKRGNASVVDFRWEPSDVTFSQIIEAAGEIPIPPYLNRDTEESDIKDYQTVYSHIEGSVAAPTAGLHFTPKVLEDIDRRGIGRRELTLHVGAGTFQPVKAERIGDHDMHSEFISVDRALIEELSLTDKRVIAVGTTSVRTLESLYHLGCMVSQGLDPSEVPQWYPYYENHPGLSVRDALAELAGYLKTHNLDKLISSTRIIIAPGYEYRVVKGMVTNFHQPQSTLLLLVSAFVDGNWKEIYDYALKNNFRFLSYGDACLLL